MQLWRKRHTENEIHTSKLTHAHTQSKRERKTDRKTERKQDRSKQRERESYTLKDPARHTESK